MKITPPLPHPPPRGGTCLRAVAQHRQGEGWGWNFPRSGIHSGGFTLLELVIAMTILGIVTVILAQASAVGIRTWETGTQQQTSSQEEAAVINMLTEQLRSAYPLRISLPQEPGAPQRGKLLVFEGGPQSIAFVTTQPIGFQDQAGLRLVVYFLEPEKESESSRFVGAYRPAYHRQFFEIPFSEDEKIPLLSGVTSLTWEYYDRASGAWLPEWLVKVPGQPEPTDAEAVDLPDILPHHEILPSAVKLTLARRVDGTSSSSEFMIPIMTPGEAEKTSSPKPSSSTDDGFFEEEDDDDDDD